MAMRHLPHGNGLRGNKLHPTDFRVDDGSLFRLPSSPVKLFMLPKLKKTEFVVDAKTGTWYSTHKSQLITE